MPYVDIRVERAHHHLGDHCDRVWYTLRPLPHPHRPSASRSDLGHLRSRGYHPHKTTVKVSVRSSRSRGCLYRHPSGSIHRYVHHDRIFYGYSMHLPFCPSPGLTFPFPTPINTHPGLLTGAVTAILCFVITDQAECHPNDDNVITRRADSIDRPAVCDYAPLVSIPCFVQAALLLAWMIWIIVLVYRAESLTPEEAFKIPVGRLCTGMYGGVASDVDLVGGYGGMVNPFPGGQVGWTVTSRRLSSYCRMDPSRRERWKGSGCMGRERADTSRWRLLLMQHRCDISVLCIAIQVFLSSHWPKRDTSSFHHRDHLLIDLLTMNGTPWQITTVRTCLSSVWHEPFRFGDRNGLFDLESPYSIH